jgi:predicted DNA-binding transcriptional regulator AlpA
MSAKFPLPLPFLRTQEAARFIGLSYRTLEKHRSRGTGPKFSKVGGRIIYAVSDLREWAELRARLSTSDPETVPTKRLIDEVNWGEPVAFVCSECTNQVNLRDPVISTEEINLVDPVPDGEMVIEVAAVRPALPGMPEAVRFLWLSRRTLEKHRVHGTGPKYTKVGCRIFYAISDLREWAERGTKRSASDPGKATVPPAKPVDEHATRLDAGVR